MDDLVTGAGVGEEMDTTVWVELKSGEDLMLVVVSRCYEGMYQSFGCKWVQTTRHSSMFLPI